MVQFRGQANNKTKKNQRTKKQQNERLLRRTLCWVDIRERRRRDSKIALCGPNHGRTGLFMKKFALFVECQKSLILNGIPE